MADPDLDRRAVRDRALGTGLQCDLITPGIDVGRDLVLTRTAGNLDLQRVQGTDNLGQVLAVALTTLLGSDVFNTRFGFDGIRAMAEETNAVLLRERIRVAVIQVLRAEPRIRRILDVKLDGGQLDPAPAGSRELDIRVEFETIAGDRADLDFGKVVVNV
jgi:phage baseplate assembly protein W